MPVDIGGQVFQEAANDELLRCDNCGEKLIREIAGDREIVRTRRRCRSCGIVYFMPSSTSGLLLAGVETMKRALAVRR